MDDYTYLLSDMDFFTECDPEKLVISIDTLLSWDFEGSKKDIEAFISQMVDGVRYSVYCLETPAENLMYLITTYTEFHQQAKKAGTSDKLIPQLNCYFQDANNNLNLVYYS